MQQALPVALSAQLALETHLATIADNVANMSTPGHRATHARFEAEVTRAGGPSIAFASAGETYIDPSRGTVSATGNALDFAVTGEAWLALETPTGAVLTRDGRFSLDEAGTLRSIEGHAVLGPEREAVVLDPRAGSPRVAADGTIRQNGSIVGAIGLFETDGPPAIRAGSSGFLAINGMRAVLDRPDVALRQGMIEQSNVDPVVSMTRLIEVSRSFETVANLAQRADGSLSEALRALGAK